jgi:hypothetical protein
MMPSMAVPPPSWANPTRKGIAWEICPRTPPRLQIEFQEDQRQYPRCPKLTHPQILPGFAVEMGEITSNKPWHWLMHARRTCINMRRQKIWKEDFGVSCIRISTPL